MYFSKKYVFLDHSQWSIFPYSVSTGDKKTVNYKVQFCQLKKIEEDRANNLKVTVNVIS